MIIPTRWGHKNEEKFKKELLGGIGIDLEKMIDGKDNENNDNNTLPAKISIPKYEHIKRKREISLAEKLYKQIEKGAVWAAKLKLKWDKFRGKYENLHELKHRLQEIDDTEDKEKFRRLITCVFSIKYIEEFISMMQALGFTELGGFEYLGRRDADYSMAMEWGEGFRLHARIYCVGDIVFVLVHHEPTADEDVMLHIKGYFDRIIHAIINRENEKGDAFDVGPDELGIEEGSNGIEKVELSDYEKGSKIYLELLKERVPNFYRKINSKIDEQLLQIWREFIGGIDHLTPEQLLIENLWENSRYIPPFIHIRDTLKRIFERFNFAIEPAWDIGVPASNQYYIAQSKNPKDPFKILVIGHDFNELILRPIGLLRAKYNPEFVLFITPDISIFGPTEDDIPPKKIEIPPFQPQKVKELLEFLRDSKISVMPVSILIKIFKSHLKNPIPDLYFKLLLSNYGLISENQFLEIMKKEKYVEKFIMAVFKLLDIFISRRVSENGKEYWISIKELEKEMKNQGILLDDSKLMDVVLIMENPIVGIIESKKHKHKEFRIIPSLDEIDIQEKREILDKMLREYLIEIKERIIN
ncbi:MAG: hypothetical protein ACTSRZ_17295 [Promethearchaeota archaeon]